MFTGRLTSFFLILTVTITTCSLSLYASEKLVLWTSNEHVGKAVKAVSKKFEKVVAKLHDPLYYNY